MSGAVLSVDADRFAIGRRFRRALLPVLRGRRPLPAACGSSSRGDARGGRRRGDRRARGGRECRSDELRARSSGSDSSRPSGTPKPSPERHGRSCDGRSALRRRLAPMSACAIVSLGRNRAMGEVRRVASWRPALHGRGRRGRRASARARPPAAPRRRRARAHRRARRRSGSRGRAWPRAIALDDGSSPDVVVVVSTRAFDPRALAGRGPWCSTRSTAWPGATRTAPTCVRGTPAARRVPLAAPPHTHASSAAANHARRPPRRGGMDRCGGARRRVGPEHWSTHSLAPVHRRGARHATCCSSGRSRYPPNVDALERMADLWPSLAGAPPGHDRARRRLAPTPRVESCAADTAGSSSADFASLPWWPPAPGSRSHRSHGSPASRTRCSTRRRSGSPRSSRPQRSRGSRPAFPLDGSPRRRRIRRRDRPSARRAPTTRGQRPPPCVTTSPPATGLPSGRRGPHRGARPRSVKFPRVRQGRVRRRADVIRVASGMSSGRGEDE